MKPEVDGEGHEELRIYPEGEKEAKNFKGRNDGIVVTHGEFGCYSKHNGKPM